ncbi:MAG TPA: ABC transporter ATP-binding protein [Thermomicrobiales bacterium]|nr:ABC transporter ATP-binding protein [Thermomicrobiales bacterium]
MQVRDVRAYYETRHGPPIRAVDGVTLDLEHGEILGIVGESGCGKSTLAAVLSASGPPNLQIASGHLTLDDRETVDLARSGGTPREWRGNVVSLLPQRALNSLNPTARIGDYAYDVVRAHNEKMRKREALELAGGRMEQLGLPSRVLDHYPHQLSGGMRQRVVTVIATLLNPTVLIADEPTSALDVSSQKALILMLDKMMEEGMISRIIFITHDLALLSNIANRVAVMYAGEIVEVGTTREVVRRPEHPYSKALIGSTLEPDPEQRGQVIYGLEGSSPDMRNPPPGCRFHPRCPYVMDVCTHEVPPRMDPEHNYATCWWVKKEAEQGHETGGVNRVTDERIAAAP